MKIYIELQMCSGSSGTGSTGLTEPVDFGQQVLEPINFSGKKTEKIETQKFTKMHVILIAVWSHVSMWGGQFYPN